MRCWFLLLMPVMVCAQTADGPRKSVWPKWMEFNGELRGRWEGSTGINFRRGNNDFYYLHRIRADLLIKPSSWFRLRITGQDVEAGGRNAPVPSTVDDNVDLFQAFVEIGNAKKSPWSIRAGRQEMVFDDELLIGRAYWRNSGRSFDAFRVIRSTEAYRMESWASTAVTEVRGEFNRFRPSLQLHGFRLDARKWLPKATVSLFHYIKIHPRETNEAGLRAARSRVHTTGIRLAGTLPRRFDYVAKTAFQNGFTAGEPLSAWASRFQLGYKPWAKNRFDPRIFAIYSYGSGDKNFGDGRRGTFDQLYPTNHRIFGIADRASWRNLHEAVAGVQWRAHKKVRLINEYHSFWLATRQDAYYDFGRRPFVRRPGAASAHLYQEWDNIVTVDVTSRIQIQAGYSRVLTGGFLREATPGSPATFPYVQWLYRF